MPKRCVIFHEKWSLFTSVWPEGQGTVNEYGEWLLQCMNQARYHTFPFEPHWELIISELEESDIDKLEVHELLESLCLSH